MLSLAEAQAVENLADLRQRIFSDRRLKMTKHYPKGLDGRMRDHDGEIRRKRSDTLIRTLRDEYGDGVAKGYRSDTKLGTVLKNEKLQSLDDLLKKRR